jgi:hypothetical protein
MGLSTQAPQHAYIYSLLFSDEYIKHFLVHTLSWFHQESLLLQPLLSSTNPNCVVIEPRLTGYDAMLCNTLKFFFWEIE